MKFTSNVARWPGEIETREFMTFVELVEWESALEAAKGFGDGTGVMAFYGALLPVACRIVTKWNIEGLPEKIVPSEFPGSPKLVAWLIESITELYRMTNSSDPN